MKDMEMTKFLDQIGEVLAIGVFILGSIVALLIGIGIFTHWVRTGGF